MGDGRHCNRSSPSGCGLSCPRDCFCWHPRRMTSHECSGAEAHRRSAFESIRQRSTSMSAPPTLISLSLRHRQATCDLCSCGLSDTCVGSRAGVLSSQVDSDRRLASRSPQSNAPASGSFWDEAKAGDGGDRGARGSDSGQDPACFSAPCFLLIILSCWPQYGFPGRKVDH